MTNNLKPCPFCGGKAYYYLDNNGIRIEDMSIEPNNLHYVMCSECPACIGSLQKSEAIRLWNNRISDKRQGVTYPCRSCVYFDECGDNMRTESCAGRMTKRERKQIYGKN